jgi:hypothetical protein
MKEHFGIKRYVILIVSEGEEHFPKGSISLSATMLACQTERNLLFGHSQGQRDLILEMPYG